MISRRLCCAALIVAACGAPPGAATATAPSPALALALAPASPWRTPFAIRGRWADPRDIRWRAELLDPGAAPDDTAAFVAALERAAAVWNATGVVGLRAASPGEPADVTFGWRRGAHDDCPPFGRSPSVAHSGPTGAGTFVHFDAGRSWDLRAAPAATDDAQPAVESLAQVAAHEWGHVLGLDHVADPAALMSPDARVATPAEGDVAGLHSLYGGGVDGPGDVHLASAAGTCTLRRVAPVDRTQLGLFDTDGDGTSELLVLRTDPVGRGALTVYRFAAGPVLVETDGPWPGIAPIGLDTMFSVDADGRRWIITRTADGTLVRLRGFGESGRLVEPSPKEVMALDIEALTDDWAVCGDVDGDGKSEDLRRSS